jgi:hypothetical protein
MHRFGPAAVHTERPCRYEDGDQEDQREHSTGRPKGKRRLREKPLFGA